MDEVTHKHLTPVEGSSDRTFGLVFAALFLIIAIYPLITGHGVRLWMLVAAGTTLLVAIFAPTLLNPANRLWAKFGELLHFIVSPVALGIVFYLVVTPTGLLMRAFNKDPLRVGLNSDTDSYWIVRNPPGPDADSLNNQF